MWAATRRVRLYFDIICSQTSIVSHKNNIKYLKNN